MKKIVSILLVLVTLTALMTGCKSEPLVIKDSDTYIVVKTTQEALDGKTDMLLIDYMGQLKEKGEVVGNHIKCKIVKNKVAPPFRVAEFDLIYGKGISHTSEVLDFAVALDLIQKSGSWFSYQGERLGQGKENARKALDANPALAKEIEDKIRAMSAETSEMITEAMESDIEGDDDFDIQMLKDDDLAIDD